MLFNTKCDCLVCRVCRVVSCDVITEWQRKGPGFDDPKLHELGYDEGMKGIIPRVMEEIFFQVAQAPPHIQIDVCASYLEIYMEKTRDLLGTSLWA